MSQFLAFSDPLVPANPTYWVAAFKQFGSFQDSGGASVAITYSFKESGASPDGMWTARPLTEPDKAQILDAMNKISETANVTFVEGDPATAELLFAATNATSGPVGVSYSGSGEVWARDLAPNTVADNSYIYKHELLHALGLDHSSSVFGGANPNLPDAEDNGTTLFGSWNSGWENHYQLFDIAALQYLYGPPNLRTGDDTYSLNPLAFDPAAPQIQWPLLWDGGGFDTLDYSALSVAVSISLVPGQLSRIDGAVGGILDGGVFSINYRTVIEAAIGGSGNDTLRGNNVANTLIGNDGNDTLVGFSGGDSLFGLAGADTLNGGAGADIMRGGSGNDTLSGAADDDRMIGGGGLDILIGGGGADKFVFSGAPTPGNRDTITDYNVAADTIQIENSVFAGIGGPGVLAAAAFHIGVAATDSSDRIIYNAANGRLYFDADGLGGAAQIQFAKLSAGLALTVADFVVI